MGMKILAFGQVKVGFWTDECLNGFGRIIYEEGGCYQGNFLNNVKHGFGKYLFTSGDYYRGYYRNGKRSFEGRFYNEFNEIEYGKWDHGSFDNTY